jgi:hypothetical protein
MAKITIVFAVLLIALGVFGFAATGGTHPTALIPAYVGALLTIFGVLAMSPDAKKRKLYMHFNVTIGLLGFLGALDALLKNVFRAATAGRFAIEAQAAMAVLLLIYVALCVRSFIAARRAGTV